MKSDCNSTSLWIGAESSLSGYWGLQPTSRSGLRSLVQSRMFWEGFKSLFFVVPICSSCPAPPSSVGVFRSPESLPRVPFLRESSLGPRYLSVGTSDCSLSLVSCECYFLLSFTCFAAFSRPPTPPQLTQNKSTADFSPPRDLQPLSQECLDQRSLRGSLPKSWTLCCPCPCVIPSVLQNRDFDVQMQVFGFPGQVGIWQG